MSKRFDIKETPFGLCSDPNAKTAPDGSMSECSNVVKRRDGILQPRNGAIQETLTGLVLDTVYRVLPFGNDALLVGPYTDGSTIKSAVWMSDPDALVVDADDDPIEFEDYEHVRITEQRGNAYVNTTTGIKKLLAPYSGADVEAVRTGEFCYATLDPPSIATLDGVWLDDGYMVGYRLTVVRKDSNGVEVESAPTGAFWVRNDTGSQKGVRLHFEYAQASFDEEDELRIYRTKQFTVTAGVDSTYYYSGSVIPSVSTDEYEDILAESELGESAYFNPSREGEKQVNDRPPLANETALFNGSMFFGGVTLPSSVAVRMPNTESDFAGADGCGCRVLSGDFTNGSPIITNIADTTGIECGQRVHRTSYLTSDEPVYVLEKTAATITLDHDAIATGSSVSVYVRDTITVGWGSTRYTITPAINTGTLTGFSAFHLLREVAESDDDDYYDDIEVVHVGGIEPGEDASYDPNPSLNPKRTLVQFIRKELGSALPYLWATNGSYYEPALNGPSNVGGVVTYDDDDGYQETVEDLSCVVMWSKTDQPEHVPTINQVKVGNSLPVLRMLTTRDVLLVFKQDGLYGITGYNADSGFSAQLLNPSVRLLRPDAAVVVDDKVYAITDQGFVIIDSQGTVTPLSLYYFHQEIKDAVDALLDDTDTTTTGCFVAYEPKNQEVIFALADVGDAYADTLYVYNIITRSFTTWASNAINHMARASDTSDTSMFIAGNYHDQTLTTAYFWKLSESEYGRDTVYDDKLAFFVGEVDGTPTAILSAADGSMSASNHLGYDGNVYEIESATLATSAFVELEDLTSGTSTPYMIHIPDDDTDYIYLSKKIVTTRRVYKFDRETLESVAYTGSLGHDPQGMCSDTNYVYWTTDDGDVYRWDGSGSEENLFTIDYDEGYGCAIYGSDIYWCNKVNGSIQYRAKDGTGSESDLITGLTDPHALLVYGDNIYWSDGTAGSEAVKVRAIAGGGVTTLASSLTGVRDLATDGTYIYYFTTSGDDTVVKRVPIGGGSVSTLETVADSTLGSITYCDDGESRVFVTDSENDTVSMGGYDEYYYTLELDSVEGFDSYIPEVDVYDPIDIVVTWLPKYGETRALRKHFLAGSFIFSEIGDLSEYQRRLSDAVSYTEADVNDTTCRYMVPIAHARKIQLEPSIKISSVENSNWELCGMSLEYTTQAPRGVKK